MKIVKIELSDFRGFPGPGQYIFDLKGEKNLLLYGENGSGKSSLYRALLEFFSIDKRKCRSFIEHRNIFSAGDEGPLTDGHVTIKLSDERAFTWSCIGERPQHTDAVPQEDREFLNDAARRASFLEYRSLLRMNFVDADIRERLFALAVTALLANVPVVGAGGKENTVSQLWTSLLQSKPVRRTPWRESWVANAQKLFNDGVKGILPEVQQKAANFLNYFTGAGIELSLDLPGVQYDGSPKLTRDRQFKNLTLDFEVKLYGVSVPEWNDILNESRLSALALSLYLAGAKLSNPSGTESMGGPLKLLVMDDVLIGLDMANRLPVLDLIENEFVQHGWQVFLFTFDRSWYEVAKTRLGGNTWGHYELYVTRAGNYEQPILLEEQEHLYRAMEFLESGQVKAAAVHVRTKFELVLKWACQMNKLSVKYNPDNRKVPASDLWTALKSATYEDAQPYKSCIDSKGNIHRWQPKPKQHKYVSQPLADKIDQSVSWVLNPLSHSESVNPYRAEIENAIFVIDELEQAILQASWRKKIGITPLREILLSLLKGLAQSEISK